MDYTQEFNNIIKESVALAVATSVDGKPNVRIVNHCIDAEKHGVIYFSSNRSSSKIGEFEKNNEIAFTSVPDITVSHAHVRSTNATVHKSALSLDEVKDLFLAQIPGFDKTLAVIGKFMDVYEIHVKEANVILAPMQAGTVTF